MACKPIAVLIFCWLARVSSSWASERLTPSGHSHQMSFPARMLGSMVGPWRSTRTEQATNSTSGSAARSAFS